MGERLRGEQHKSALSIFEQRREEIYLAHRAGTTVPELALRYRLSRARIQAILHRVAQRQRAERGSIGY